MLIAKELLKIQSTTMLRLSILAISCLLLATHAISARITLDCGDIFCVPRIVRTEGSSLKPEMDGKSSETPQSIQESAPKASTKGPGPALCRPSQFQNYRNFIDTRPIDKITSPSESKADCCLTCYNFGDCISFSYDTDESACIFFVITGDEGNRAQKEDPNAGQETNRVCPSGVGEGFLELPGYPMLPRHFGHEYGPCLGGTPSGGGLDWQKGGDSVDEQILALPKDEAVEDDANVELV